MQLSAGGKWLSLTSRARPVMDFVVLFEIEGSVIHQIVQNIVRHHWQCEGKSSSNNALGIFGRCVVNSEGVKVSSTVKALSQ